MGKMKRMAALFVRFLGYEIRKVGGKNRPLVEPRQAGNERDKEGYEKIWANETYIELYKQMHHDYYNNLLEFIQSTNVLDSARSIADIGCGPGNFLYYIEKYWPGRDLYGFDFSLSALKVAAIKSPTAKLKVHDVYDPLNQKFDTVLCCETLEHLLYPEKALSNVLNCALSKCVLTVPDGRTDTYQGHINFWSEESWGIFLKGWENEWNISTHRIGDRLAAVLVKRT